MTRPAKPKPRPLSQLEAVTVTAAALGGVTPATLHAAASAARGDAS